VDVSPDGKLCAVGFRDGSFRIFETQGWKTVAKKKMRKSWVQDLKFAPNGKLLAVSSHDRIIDLFELPSLNHVAPCKGHTSFITHIDWSMDSNSLHSNDGSYELLYWNASTGKMDASGASNFRDEQWHTWSCILGWPVQGIWPPGADGSDINGVDRSHAPHSDGYFLVATADDFS